MNRSLIILYVLVVVIVGYVFFKFSNESRLNQSDSQTINRIETSSATKKKVDEIFAQIDWDYNTYRTLRRSPNPSDSQEIVGIREKYKKLRIELVGLGQEAYPAIFKYAVGVDKSQRYFASEFIRDLNDAAIEPLMVLVGSNSFSKNDERTFEAMINSAARSDNESLIKFLSSANLKERSIAAKLLAQRAHGTMGRNSHRYHRYSYRYSDYSRSRDRKHMLPLENRAKLIELYKSEKDNQIKADLATIIGSFGEDLEDIKPELIAFFNNESSELVKTSWAEVLGFLASQETVNGARDTLKPLTDTLLVSKSNNLRHAIISTLNLSRKKLNSDSVKALEKMTGDNVESISIAALETLALASEYRTDCNSYVMQSLNSTNSDTVRNGLRAAARMKEGVDAVLPKVFDLARTDSNGSSACGAISQMGSKVGAKAVPVLREILRSNNRNKSSAISALEHMGQAAKEALPELKKIASGSDLSLKNRAERLIERIDSGRV